MKISFCCEAMRDRVAEDDIEVDVESLVASFRRPDGTYDDSDVIHSIDALVNRMIDDGAIELEVMPC